jgi:alpha-tubulin suppressor-like RCC1 family protein
MTWVDPTNNQSAFVGDALPLPPSVRVFTEGGQPVSGAPVVFAVVTGGGEVTGATTTTDASGIARIGSWRLGTSPGANVLSATSGSLVLQIIATAVAGPPSTITKTAVDGFMLGRGVAAPVDPSILVEDRFGNPVPGTQVQFIAATGSSTVANATTVTGASGAATSGVWRMGPPGPQLLEARVGELPPVSFAAESFGLDPVIFLATGKLHSCAGTTHGIVFCWGFNNEGQVGNGEVANSVDQNPNSPRPVNTALKFVTVAGGLWHTCGSTTSGEVYCWGNNEQWQLGRPAAAGRSLIPVQVPAPSLFSLSAGTHDTCGLSASGEVYCWGSGVLPTLVSGAHVFVRVGRGNSHTCALKAGGELLCWGGNEAGQLGDGTRTARANPEPVKGGRTYSFLAVGNRHSCAIANDGGTYCWGSNSGGHVGDSPDRFEYLEPAAIEGPPFATLSAGLTQTCGLTPDGVAYCWGTNIWGELGDGGAAPATVAVPVAGGLRFTQISAGNGHTCAVSASNAAYCWGANTLGALGIGSTGEGSRVPVAVQK